MQAQTPKQNYVNTFVGTAASNTRTAGLFGKHSEEYGQTLPAVLIPHGMNFWTPQTRDTEHKCVAPYYYKDTKIQGFRNSHWIVGGCTQDYGSMTLMTVTGQPTTDPVSRASRFSHLREVSSPSYYSVYLDDYQAQAEMTGTSRAAIFRFTYDKAGMAYIVVNHNNDFGEGHIVVDVKNKEIRGFNPVRRIYQGWGDKAGFSGYFVVKFQKVPAVHAVDGKCAYIGFRVAKGEKVVVKVASSFTDMAGAERNLTREIPAWNFDMTRRHTSEVWEKYLGKIQVEGNDTAKRMFYSAFYRASFLPRIFNDVDGRYPSFSKGMPIQTVSGRDYYDDFSMWDTYRALHPLLTIIEPRREGEIVQSLVDKYQQGGWLPIFPCWNSYTAAMIGDHAISVIGDAYIKGITGFDIRRAYEAMRHNAFDIPSSAADYKNGMGRRALDSYLKYGYIPLEDSVKEAFHQCEQVSRTLEYAYDDYVLAQVAGKLGRDSDYAVLMQRAQNYRKVINPLTGYACGRYADGTFLKDSNPFTFQRYITEGAPCHYTWYVPQDVAGLMAVMGGEKAFVGKLDSMFSEHRYWHGNEPCHQIAYLYDYTSQPWKTQREIANIRSTEYLDAPGGLSGNDDAGQMSAWYLFSALGFYPVCPGTPYYAIGTPSLDEASIHLDSGRTFTVRAKNLSSRNIYIQRITLNGKPFSGYFITHSQIMAGGVLEMIMTDEHPSTDGAAAHQLHE